MFLLLPYLVVCERPVTLSGQTPRQDGSTILLGPAFTVNTSFPPFISLLIPPASNIGENSCRITTEEYPVDYLYKPNSTCLIESFSEDFSSLMSRLVWLPPRLWTGSTTLPVNVTLIDPLGFAVLSSYILNLPVTAVSGASPSFQW